jgi:hypothetical protein
MASVPSKMTNKLCTHAHHSDRSAAEAVFADGTYFVDTPRIYGDWLQKLLTFINIVLVCWYGAQLFLRWNHGIQQTHLRWIKSPILNTNKILPRVHAYARAYIHTNKHTWETDRRRHISPYSIGLETCKILSGSLDPVFHNQITLSFMLRLW